MLAETTLARPYAKAAFSLAEQSSTVESWSASLETVSGAVQTEAMKRVIGHPKVDDERLMSLFDEVLGESADRPFRSFLKVLMHYRRLSLLPEIAAQFETLRRASEQRLKVNVTSAVEMGPDQLEKLSARLREKVRHRHRNGNRRGQRSDRRAGGTRRRQGHRRQRARTPGAAWKTSGPLGRIESFILNCST